VQATSSEISSKVQEAFHPLRFQRWVFSDLNPWMAWLAPAAEAVKAQRQALPANAPARKAERALSEMTSAALDYYRDVRDAVSEAAFFQVYGNLFSLYMADKASEQQKVAHGAEPRELPVVQEALAAIGDGGYAEAVARTAALLARKGEPMPLERLHLRHELMEEYRELLPEMPRDEQRRIRGEQDIIVRYEPEQALETLPRLLANPDDRKRLLDLFDRLLRDERFQSVKPTADQTAMFEQINGLLRTERAAVGRLAAVRNESAG
jgi:hypothetical protein